MRALRSDGHYLGLGGRSPGFFGYCCICRPGCEMGSRIPARRNAGTHSIWGNDASLQVITCLRSYDMAW